MGAFTNNAITENGRLLLADAQTGGEFIATKIVMGSGYIPAGKTARTMTAVVSPVKDLLISKIERTNDGKVIIGGAFSNEDITTEFYFRELALYARCVWRDADGNIIKTGEEKLYSYGNAGAAADLIPAYSTSTLVEKQIDLVTYVGNDTTVNLTVESGIYQAPIKDAPTKDVPVDADSFAIVDSEAGNATKRLTWARLKAATGGYFDSLYAKIAHNHTWGEVLEKPSEFMPSAHKSTHSIGGNDALMDADIGISPDVAAALGLSGNPQVGDALEKLNALINSNAKINSGTYVGTGTPSSQNSLTFPFVPKLVFIFSESNKTRGSSGLLTPVRYTNSFQNPSYWCFTEHNATLTTDGTYAKIVGNTVSWYFSPSDPMRQFNDRNAIYYYTAIG